MKLSRKTAAIIKQKTECYVLTGDKPVIRAGDFGRIISLWLAVLADTGASILVTLNGMRLDGR